MDVDLIVQQLCDVPMQNWVGEKFWDVAKDNHDF